MIVTINGQPRRISEAKEEVRDFILRKLDEAETTDFSDIVEELLTGYVNLSQVKVDAD